MDDFLTPQEVEAVRNSLINVKVASLEAEKALAMKRVAELEHGALVQRIYDAHELKLGVDQVTQEGRIIRAVTPVQG